MRFLVHGTISPEAQAALAKHEHACHTLQELAPQADTLDQTAGDPALLLPLLEKKQWNLLTTDTEWVRAMYDRKIVFSGVIVLILPDPDAPQDQAPGGGAIDRLFERYKRLTPRRLYTITPSRVKIRQLPGGHA